MKVESALRARLLAGIGLLVMFGLGWRVLSLGLADHWAATDPERALDWRPSHPQALARAAQQRLDAGDSAAAERFARQAVAASPLEGGGYKVLALVAEARGDVAQARDLLVIAGRHAPRDVAIQAKLVEYALKANDAEAAIAHVDVMLRVQPALRADVIPRLIAWVEHPALRAAIIDMLAAGPSWRAGFLQQLANNGADRDNVDQVFAGLKPAPIALSAGEITFWLDRLMRDGRWSQAYVAWVERLDSDALPSVGNLFDGGFELPPANSGFGWRFGRIAGARIDRIGTSGATGQVALRVGFEHRRVPFTHVSQLLVLPPGDYEFNGRVRLDTLRNERGLVWTISCTGGTPAPRIATTEFFRGDSPWRAFETRFSVPATGCPGQWLRLELSARTAAERMVGGVAWFDALSIVRE